MLKCKQLPDRTLGLKNVYNIIISRIEIIYKL
jgi:hypothetical protein